MKNLKVFENISTYNTIKKSLEYPTVSRLLDGNGIRVLRPENKYSTLWYNVTDISAPTKLFNDVRESSYIFDVTHLTELKVDGKSIEPSYYYQFDTVGVHKVDFTISTNEAENVMFAHVNDLVKAEFANSIKRIGSYTFYENENLTEVTYNIEECEISNAFLSCPKLTSIAIPKSMTFIPSSMMAGSPINHIVAYPFTAPTLYTFSLLGVSKTGVIDAYGFGYETWLSQLGNDWVINAKGVDAEIDVMVIKDGAYNSNVKVGNVEGVFDGSKTHFSLIGITSQNLPLFVNGEEVGTVDVTQKSLLFMLGDNSSLIQTYSFRSANDCEASSVILNDNEGWEYSEEVGGLRSKTISNNEWSSIYINTEDILLMKMVYGQSSEKNYDYTTIYEGTTPMLKLKGSVYQGDDLSLEYKPKSSQVELCYEKDESDGDGLDCIWVKEIQLTKLP